MMNNISLHPYTYLDLNFHVPAKFFVKFLKNVIIIFLPFFPNQGV